MPIVKAEPLAAGRTMSAGATAKTYTLPVVPTSCGRYWMLAWMFATVGVMLPVTTIGKTGATALTVATVLTSYSAAFTLPGSAAFGRTSTMALNAPRAMYSCPATKVLGGTV